MSTKQDTFLTCVGCMDGRIQKAIATFGNKKFNSKYPDTITEAGMDGVLAKQSDEVFTSSLKKKILISVEKHHSKGIIVHGHEDCAGNPVDDKQHKKDILVSVKKVKKLIEKTGIDVIGVYVHVSPKVWVEEI